MHMEALLTNIQNLQKKLGKGRAICNEIWMLINRVTSYTFLAPPIATSVTMGVPKMYSVGHKNEVRG